MHRSAQGWSHGGIVDPGRRRTGHASPSGEVVAAFEDHAVALPRPTSGDLRPGLPHLLIFVGLVRRLVGGLGRTERELSAVAREAAMRAANV
jgi:hypothetical protein